MDNKFILTDGQKSVNLLNSSDPSVWSYFSNAPKSNNDELYAKVSAVFRAFNLKANTVGNMPFVLVKQAVKEGGKVKATGDEQVDDTAEAEEFDNSATWENKVGFLPNPSELLRLDTLSYIATNTIYNLRTSDILGRKTKGLYHAVPTAFGPIVNAMGTNVDRIERQVGTQIERYKFPDDKMLVRMWRLDHTTELLPSKNTEMEAIAHAAGIVFYADAWIMHFFGRGGIAPTVIAMKGAVNPAKRDEEEKSWTDWLLGLGSRFRWKPTRVTNAEALDVKQFGSSVTELKDNTVYNSALANIAMGTGMPLSLLMANSANYATAKEEKSTWYENDIIPLCNWIAYEYNRQVFNPIGLRLEFQPETLDPQQEDETERAQAMSAYMKVLNECPTEEVFLGMAAMMGLEIPDELRNALSAFYTDKQKKEEEMQAQIQAGGYTVGPDGKPIPAQAQKPGEKKPKLTKAFDTSAMIALRIPNAIRDEIKKRYSFVDAETLNNLHITLVYLGDNRTIDKMDVMRAVSDFGMYQSPIKGTLQGLARFVNGGDKDPLVVTFDSHQMPSVYNTLCNVLDNYHVPYHRDHGFIPHMTLAYIPTDADMPIETIEPMEINFSDVYYVDGNVWLPVDFTGYENKTKAAKFVPTLDQSRELQRWQELAFRKLKRGDAMPIDWRNDTLPDVVYHTIAGGLQTATDEAGIKTAFDVAEYAEEVPEKDGGILELAKALNRFVDASLTKLPTT